MPSVAVSKHLYASLRQVQITVPDWHPLKLPKPPPAPVFFGVQASPVIGVPSHGSSPGKPPPWPEPPAGSGEDPPTPGEPPAAFDEPPVAGAAVPPVPVAGEPAFDELPPLLVPPAPTLPSVLLPQAVAAPKLNTKIPK